MLRSRSLCATLLAAAAMTMLLALPASGQWTTQSNVNTAVSTVNDHIDFTQIVKGANNGTFVLWSRTWSGGDVYLQFVDSSGQAQASDRHVASGWDPVMVSDGSGGVIVAWIDTNYRVRAQRYDSSLTAQWTSAAVLATVGYAYDPAILDDGAGGAIVSWTQRSVQNGQPDIHAQRVDSTGAVLWNATTGFVVVSTTDNQNRSALARGSATGSAFVTWTDDRAGTANADIWIRFIDPSGSASWSVEQPVVTASHNQSRSKVVADGSGGAIVAWQDSRNGLGELFVQKIGAAGLHLWSPWNGVLVGRSVYSLGYDLGSDGSGGAVLAWSSASPGWPEIHFQQVDSSGAKQWGTGTVGLPLTSGATSTNQQTLPALHADGAGGAVVAWQTASKTSGSVGDIYAQYVEAGTGAAWSAGGLVVSNAADAQHYPDVVSDGECPAKISWSDDRTDGDPYIQRIKCPGVLGIVKPNGGVWLAHEAPAALGIDESGEVGIVGGSSGDGPGVIGPGVIEVSFDVAFLRVLEIVPGSIGEFEATVDEELGVVRIETFTDAELHEGEPLFRLVVQGVADGSSVLAFTGAEFGEETYVTSSASVIRVGHGGEEGGSGEDG